MGDYQRVDNSSDWEIPSDNVVASPGGLSSTHHHYTHGMYGTGGVDFSFQPTEYGIPNGGIMPTPSKENFEVITPVEEIKDLKEKFTLGAGTGGSYKISNPVILFILFVLFYISLDFWSQAGTSFIEQVINKGEVISWGNMVIFALVFTLIFVIIISYIGIPVTTFE